MIYIDIIDCLPMQVMTYYAEILLNYHIKLHLFIIRNDNIR